MGTHLLNELKHNTGSMSKVLIITYRYGNWVYYSVEQPIVKKVLFIVYKIMDLLFVKLLNHAEIDHRSKIGRGLRLPHGGSGIVIHCDSVIGQNVTIFHQVTIGTDQFDYQNYGPPNIADGVVIGCGAKLIGKIKIGRGARIGANAVVIKDVPDDSTAVGVPARIILRENIS